MQCGVHPWLQQDSSNRILFMDTASISHWDLHVSHTVQVPIHLLGYLTCSSIYLPSCISHMLARLCSSEFTHCQAQDNITSHWGKASRGCCGKHPFLPSLFP